MDPMTRFLTAVAPIRIADLGGWTDTWFAGHGLVCSVAVQPGATVRLAVTPAGGDGGSVTIDAADFGDRYDLREGRGRHPLLEACIDEVGVPAGAHVTVSVASEVPPGASTGTSAAVTVALVGALRGLAGSTSSPAEVAATAHRVESDRLGRQTGIQDQQAAAHGGINRIAMTAYPSDVSVEPVGVAAATAWELEQRLVLVFLGRTHVSSAVHDAVISSLETREAAFVAARLDPLRRAAADGAAALEAGDLSAYGRALVANTEAQVALHPDLVSGEAAAVIEAAAASGAVGWKVNGAGGTGGSVTLLAGPEPGGRRRIVTAVEGIDPSFRHIPITLDRVGLRVWTVG
jgi:D-glycero-alpha-D-manno-heptose-7-phosphate kinase